MGTDMTELPTDHFADHPTERLPLAAAGLLDDGQAAEIAAHVRRCPVCADELRGWEGIATAARTAAATPPRPGGVDLRRDLPDDGERGEGDSRNQAAGVAATAAATTDSRSPHRPAAVGAAGGASAAPGTTPEDPRTTQDGRSAHHDDLDAGAYAPLAHLTVEKVERYRSVLIVFAAERERFLIHLRPDDVAQTLGEGVTPLLHEELAKLVGWGNLRDLPDTQRVTTVEDFRSRRRLYALTPAGEAAEQAVGVFTRALGRRAELQTVALADISAGLAALRALIGQAPLRDSRTAVTPPPPMDAGRAAAILRDLTGVFEALAENAAAFMSSLARAIDAAADRGTFLTYKERLLSYLQRFLTDLVSRSAQIAGELTAIGDVTPVVAAVAAREAVDAAPEDADDLEGEIAARTAAWLRRWGGLRAWFLGTSTTPAQADLLRQRALTSIRELLAAAAALNERRTGRSDRAADYRALARWFADAPGDDACHRLWRAAFGASSSRHLTVDGDTLARREDEPVAAATSWREAEPVRISPRLRATGHHERRGRLHAVSDRTDGQAALRRLLAEERTDLAALELLPRGRPLRLSELRLDAEAFAVLLDLLSDALAASAPTGGRIETESRDGSLRIVLDPPVDGRQATIPTPHGHLRGPDHVLTLHPAVTT